MPTPHGASGTPPPTSYPPTSYIEGDNFPMSKHILVALPLGDDLQARLKSAVPSFTYRFTTQETATLEEI